MKPSKELKELIESLPVTDHELEKIPGFIPFLEHFVTIKEGKFSFEKREWLKQICRDASRTIHILKARQVGASVFLASYITWYLLKNPGLVAVYVTDRFDHVKQYHFDKLGLIIDSPKLSRYVRDNTIKTTRFTNGSVLHKISAFQDMERARGISADLVIVDEAQGVHLQNLPDLLETQTMSKNPKTIIAGTGNNEGSEWQAQYLKSSQQEWINGKWQGRPSNIAGYRISQELLFTWDELEEKRSQYTPAQFDNEVLAKFTQGLKIPLSPGVVRESCTSEPMPGPADIDKSMGPLYCGIDLAGGGLADTVITIAQYIDKNPPKLHIIHAEKSGEYRTEPLAEWLLDTLHDYEPEYITIDNGGNNAVKQILQKEYGDRIKDCWLGEQKLTVDLDKFKEENLIKVNKPDCMQRLVDLFITPGPDGKKRIILPMTDKHEWLIDHYTADEAILTETVARPSTLRYKKMKGRKDDALMSLLFLYIGYLASIDDSHEHRGGYATNCYSYWYSEEERGYVEEKYVELDGGFGGPGRGPLISRTVTPVEGIGPKNKLDDYTPGPRNEKIGYSGIA